MRRREAGHCSCHRAGADLELLLDMGSVGEADVPLICPIVPQHWALPILHILHSLFPG